MPLSLQRMPVSHIMDFPDMSEPTPSSNAPIEVTPDASRKVAIVGEIPFSGLEVAKAVMASGMVARVLCPNSAVEAKLRELPNQSKLEIVDGDLGNATAVSSVLEGVYGACFVSPIGLSGRLYRGSEHINDVSAICKAAETHTLRKVVYHSGVGALVGAQSRALQDAAAAEAILKSARCKSFIIRTGPVIGKGDGFMTDIVNGARASGPLMGISGYGGTLVQPLAVADFAQCMAHLFTAASDGVQNGTYALVGPETLTLLDLTDSALSLLKRSKVKFHMPLFALQLLAKVSGSAKFNERVGLLFDAFAVEQNDAPKLFGSKPKLIAPIEVQRALIAG